MKITDTKITSSVIDAIGPMFFFVGLACFMEKIKKNNHIFPTYTGIFGDENNEDHHIKNRNYFHKTAYLPPLEPLLLTGFRLAVQFHLV